MVVHDRIRLTGVLQRGPSSEGPRHFAAAYSPPVPSPDDDARPPLRARLDERGRQALRSYVRRSGDRRLERTLGSRGGLRVLFGAMARRFVPERADGFTGDIQYDLGYSDGAVRTWTVSVGAERATARPGPAPDPALTIAMSLADLLRLAGGDLQPFSALLAGRLELAGDLNVAMRLGPMFGQPSG
jgi:putative sterol carrier protein